ncbi:MAG: hypothetical protein GEU90_06890 [Gemmatimonas sp.]|nr:hypothetical protein [Gemmatimonas sp.]
MRAWRRGLVAPICGALASTVLLACSDGTSPAATGVSVRIRLGLAEFDEQTIAIGESLQLSAEVLNETGDPIDGQNVEWSSDRTDVATVSGTGRVNAVGLGTAQITARHAAGEEIAIVNVAQSFLATDLPDCGAADALTLGVGEALVVAGPDALPICLGGGADGDAEYAMAAVNLGSTAASILQVRIDGVGVVQSAASTNRVSTMLLSDRPTTNERFHNRIRGEIPASLEHRLNTFPEAEALGGPSYQIGVDEVLSFNVNAAPGDGCAAPDLRGGRVRYVGEHAVAVADTMNPAGGFTDADYKALVDFFDDDVWPLVTENFGEPSDIDGTQKVYIFFTRAVNELGENQPRGSSYVGGFFFNRDLFPTSSCEGSNVAEMFYLLVPDPTGETGGRAFSPEFVYRSNLNVLVHEFQHLVNDSRRLHVNHVLEWEEGWLGEGLSHIAEELMFFRKSDGLGPAENIGPVALAENQRASDAFRIYQLDNLERLKRFLQEPAGHSVIGGANLLETRGASRSFLRYSADQQPGEDTALWQALVRDTRHAGLANLEAALGMEPADLIRDWAAALYADDLLPGSEARFQLPSWNFRAIWPVAGTLGLGTPNQNYPLIVRPIEPTQVYTEELSGGGALYTRAVVPADQVAAIRYVLGSTPPYLPLPARVQVVVMRVD